ncbi:MAG: class I tRNA ligase family protein, partial [Terrimesophilobacter sp.]
KVLNAAKFVYSFPESSISTGSISAGGSTSAGGSISEPLDIDMLAELGAVVALATKSLEEYDHARALEAAEQFFWTFCDDYLEVVKERAYGAFGADGQASASAALHLAVDVLLRLFAPVIPFATDEVWSWTHDGSVHTAAWPTPPVDAAPTGLLGLVSEALIGIRRAKTEAKASQKTEVITATLTGPALLQEAADDVRAVGRIATLEFVEAPNVAVTSITLAETTE